MAGSDLTIRVDSEAFRALKAEAITLDLSIDELASKIISSYLSSSIAGISLEEQINIDGDSQLKGLIGKNFTDEGARAYSQAARYEFQKHSAKKGIDSQSALAQLSEIALKYHGDIQLINKILLGRHVLTGQEMVDIIELNGYCPLQKTLQDWSRDSLSALCKVFVEAIEI